MILDPNLFDCVKSAYDAADKAVKQYERYTLSAPVAAINQLRYAGYHLLQAQSPIAENKEAGEHLENALRHCKRAWSDAFEGIIYSHLGFIADFQNLCRCRNDVEKVYPDYETDYIAITSLQERLQTLGPIQGMSQEEKDEILDIANSVTALKRKILKIKHIVDDLSSRRECEDAKCLAQQFLVPFVATVLGTVVGVVGLLVAVWSLLSLSWWWRLCSVALILAVCFVATKIFFKWSINHMLTEKQRQLLRKGYGLHL